MSQRYRVPVGVLVLILIGLVALVSIDAALLAQDPERFLADLRLMFVIATLGAALWLTVRLIRTWLEQMGGRLDRIEETVAAREGPTIPMQRVRIVGAVSMPKADDELPGYAKGYVDGLTRTPIGSKGRPIIEGPSHN